MDTSVDRTLTPAKMAERTGVTIDTLRYYELHVALGVIDHKLDIYRSALGLKGTS